MNKLRLFIILFLNIVLFGQSKFQPAKFVDPFIGTDAHGHTYPGASLPFGMVQLSPDTRNVGWDWCSGYHSSDSSLLGFSHTHLSGTGGADYGDILFTATTGEVKLTPGDMNIPLSGYRSRFSHKTEKAEPGYYSVFLNDYNVKVELTVTRRTGFHKYIFPKTKDANIILDLTHGISDSPVELYLKILDNRRIEGYRKSSGWAAEHTVYFYAEFNQPFIDYGANQNNDQFIKDKFILAKDLKAFFRFDATNNNIVLMKIGISHTSLDGARKNLQTENKNWDFEKVRRQAFEEWNKELSKIIVETKSKEKLIIFYTALYHTMLTPNIMNDVDGYYYGMDRKIHKAEGFEMYTVFSLWDTFRALHPLLTIIDKKRTRDFVLSLYNKYKERNILPVWELASNETGCMIGYHSIPVIVDAIVKGVKGLPLNELFEAFKVSAMQDELGVKFIKQLGYVPMDKETDATSRTLEYAYDDWCIAQLAKMLKKSEDYDYFLKRSLNYRNVFNPETGFMQGRYYNGTWKKNFNPSEAFGLGVAEFTEGSAWQYTWFVPHNVMDLIDLKGGRNAFRNKLDELFTRSNNEKFLPSDMTGMIGEYVHGNEPSHHIPYLYNYAGFPFKTQERVRYICDNLYHTGRDGLCGNEDCGQMSAWYVFSSIGFYPVTPGSDLYAIGSPMFDKVQIKLENGKVFKVITKNNSDKNFYIEKAFINGKKFNNCLLKHSYIENGNTLTFEMSDKPNPNWGLANDMFKNLLLEEPKNNNIQSWLYMPSINTERRIFNNELRIKLETKSKDAEIRYTTDGSIPTENSVLFRDEIIIDKSLTLKARAFKKGVEPSEILEERFIKAITYDEANPYFKNDEGVYPKIEIFTKPHQRYSGVGVNTLIDGIRATQSFVDKNWLGYQGNNLECIIDLGRVDRIKKITLGLLRNQVSWIFLPKQVVFYKSNDKINFEEIGKLEFELSKNPVIEILDVEKEFDLLSTRYIKIFIENIGICPEWHSGNGNPAFFFIDEIMLQN